MSYIFGMETKTRWVRAAALAAVGLACTVGCAKGRGEGAPAASASAESEAENLQKLTLDELDAKKKEAAAGKLALFIFDNNEKDRFDKGHIPGATWVKFDDVQAKDLPPDKGATLVFYCANEH